MVTELGAVNAPKVDSGNGRSILSPVMGSPRGAEVDRTIRSPIKGRLWRGNVVLHTMMKNCAR